MHNWNSSWPRSCAKRMESIVLHLMPSRLEPLAKWSYLLASSGKGGSRRAML
jgi:hypothetical protein